MMELLRSVSRLYADTLKHMAGVDKADMTPAITANSALEAHFNLGRTRGVPSLPMTDTATGETGDVDLLQEFLLENELIDVDWFSLNLKGLMRSWLRPERRLAFRQWETGDTAEVCGHRGGLWATERVRRIAVVKAYLPKRRRFQCVLDEEEDEGKDKGKVKATVAGNKKDMKREKKLKLKPKPAARRNCWHAGLQAGALLLGEVPEDGVAGAQELLQICAKGDGEGQCIGRRESSSSSCRCEGQGAESFRSSSI